MCQQRQLNGAKAVVRKIKRNFKKINMGQRICHEMEYLRK